MSDAIDLAHVPLFKVGDLRVEPSGRSIRGDEGVIVVEPRVLQLLVALSQMRGRVLSHDDLIQRVWGGRVVGENAVHRAVSRVRGIAATTGNGSFSIETVKGVGYKLVERGPKRREAVPGLSRVDRRAVLAGVGLLAVAAAGAAWLSKPLLGGTGGLAEDLFERAEVARRDEEDRISAQLAIALYRQALREDPQMPGAWGGLALAYKQVADFDIDARVTRNAELALAAADQALKLDSKQPQGRLASIVTRPAFGDWQKRIAALRSINDTNQGWEFPSELSYSLANVGQFSEAATHAREALADHPMLPGVKGRLFRLLWATGRLFEAEKVLEEALASWPRRWSLWNAKFHYLALAGRNSDALSFLRSEANLPINLSPGAVDRRIRGLRILSGEDSEGRENLIRAYVEDCRKYSAAVPNASMMLAALGAKDELFAVLNGYYFGVPPVGRRLTQYSRRWTAFLFMPPFDPLRGNPRFRSLLNRIKLPVRLT